jgi:hypothetical protein
MALSSSVVNPGGWECDLVRSASYVEKLVLRPIQSLPGHFELLISSQFLSARNPDEWRVAHRVISRAENLAGLHKMLAGLVGNGG